MTTVVNTRTLSAETTGVQRYVRELMARMGDRVVAVAPHRPLHGLRGHLWEQFVLPKSAADRVLWSPAGSGPLSVPNQVLTVHDVAPLEEQQWFSWRFNRWYRYLIPRLARRAKRIITVSEFTKARLCRLTGVRADKVTVVLNGVDQRFRSRSLEEQRAVRAALGLPPSDRFMLSVGSIEPRKNLVRLIQGWSKAVPAMPDDFWLVISGRKGDPSVFRDAGVSQMPPRVHWTGYVPDEYLPGLYSSAHAFCFPSLYEGFGLPIAEAMACGIPVITSNTSALAEIAGGACLTVDPLNSGAIAEALVEVSTNETLCKQLASSGRNRVSNMSWETAARATVSVLENSGD